MRIFRLLPAFSGLLLATMPAAAQSTEARLAWVVERGRLLFDLDRAAWVGTDDAMARIGELAREGLRGYIVEPEGGAYTVTFFGGPADAPVAYYRGRVENHRVVDRELFPVDGRPPLTAIQRRLADVRDRAGQLGRRPCGDASFNTAIVPPATPDGPIDLYLLTPQVDRNTYPFGGHYRFTIGADGSVQASRAFTRTCLAMNSRQGIPADATPVALTVTHLLDPIPTEIHVFTALSSGLDLYVATGDRTWHVSRDRIRLLEERSGRSKR